MQFSLKHGIFSTVLSLILTSGCDGCAIQEVEDHNSKALLTSSFSK
jgi:hypothetical protein